MALVRVFPGEGSPCSIPGCRSPPHSKVLSGQNGWDAGWAERPCRGVGPRVTALPGRAMAGPWEKATVPGQCSSGLPGTIPSPGERRREDALHPRLQGFLKGTGKRERLCHRSYEPDLSGLVPYLFMNGGVFPVSCFPGVILNSQPFVPRHRPGLGTSAPHCSPFQPAQH